MKKKEKIADASMINELRREFYEQLSKGNGKFREPIEEIKYSDKIGVAVPDWILKPKDITDYTNILRIAECKHVLKRLIQEDYSYFECRDSGTFMYCVLTKSFAKRSSDYAWVIIVNTLLYNTCYLECMTVKEVEEVAKADKVPLKMLAVALGVNVSYIWDFSDKIIEK